MSFLASLWAGLRLKAGLAVGVMLVALLAGQSYRLDRAQTALLIEQASHAATQAQLSTCGASLTAVQAHSDQLDQAAARAQARLDAAAAAFESKVKKLRAQPAPATCEAAIELLRKDAAGGL